VDSRNLRVDVRARIDVGARRAGEAPDGDGARAGASQLSCALARRCGRRGDVVDEQDARTRDSAHEEGAAHVGGAPRGGQAALDLGLAHLHEPPGGEGKIEPSGQRGGEDLGRVVPARAAGPGRGRHGGDLVGVGPVETLRDDGCQARAEVVGALELEGEEDPPRTAAIPRGRAQPLEVGRVEQAAPAPRIVGCAGQGFVASAAPRGFGDGQPVPAIRADAPPKELVGRARAARQAVGGQEESRGGPRQPLYRFRLKRSRVGLRKLGKRRNCIRFIPGRIPSRVIVECRNLKLEVVFSEVPLLTCKRSLLLALFGVALAAPALPQTWGLGATYGSVNNVNQSFSLDGFKPSEYTFWADYRMEKSTLLRMTYGSMWTTQALAGQTVTTPSGPATMPGYKERINYLTVDVSYVYWQGFYTGGIFAGVGGYSFKPQPVAPEFSASQDLDQRVFGLNAGLDGEFRVTKNFGVVLRFTYHNVMADPLRRQFFNADAGLVGRF
jgi:hypothetical protein